MEYPGEVENNGPVGLGFILWINFMEYLELL
jgi:hypothetical protein